MTATEIRNYTNQLTELLEKEPYKIIKIQMTKDDYETVKDEIVEWVGWNHQFVKVYHGIPIECCHELEESRFLFWFMDVGDAWFRLDMSYMLPAMHV